MPGRVSSYVGIARVAAVLAFAALALPSAAAWAQARTPTHVACVGDSITYGYLASSSSKSYPSDLQGLFGSSVKVMNFGRNSATLLSTGDLPYINQSEYTAATTFVSNAGASAVVDVIIMLGTNDSKSYNWMPTAGTTRAAQFMTDLGAMVDHFTGLGTHPVVYLALPPAITTNSFGISETVTFDQIDPIIQQVATQKGMPIIDVHTPTAPHPEDFQDGVHPTDAGYMFVAQVMHDGLLRVPTVAITMPAANASIAGTSVGISADASGGTVPIASVQFFRGTTSIATVTQSPFTTTWTNAAPGPTTLTAKATDKTGAAATSAPVSITVAAGGGGAGGASGGGGGGIGGAGGSGGGAGRTGSGGRGGSGGGAGGGLAGRGGAGGGAAGAGGGSAGGATGGGAGTGGTAGSGGASGAAGAIGAGGGVGSGGTSAAGGSGGAAAGGAQGAAGSTGNGGNSGPGGATTPPGETSSGGCSCMLGRGTDSSFVEVAPLLLAALGSIFRRRRRARSQKGPVLALAMVALAVMDCGPSPDAGRVDAGGSGGAAAGGHAGGAGANTGGNTGGVAGGNTGGIAGGNTGGIAGGNTGGIAGGNTGGIAGGNTGGAGACQGILGAPTPGEVPTDHRAAATACSPTASTPPDGGPPACATDADCAGNGTYLQHCLHGVCSVDDCLSDADCTNAVCGCGNGGPVGTVRRNVCVSGNCRTDADCGAGGYCSPSLGYCGSYQGFYCHGPSDTCINANTDCGTCSASCLYAPTVGAFVCGSPRCAG